MRGRYILVAAALAVVADPALAEAPAPFPEVVSKRVKPPKPGTIPRVTVQIGPEDIKPTAAAPAAKSGATTPVADTRYGWFWDEVSPRMADSGPGRLAPALRGLSLPGGPGVSAPRLQMLQDIAARHSADLLRATVGTRVSPALALAVMAVESGGRADAVSHAGARGLMQLMPATAARFGVDDSFDPAQNIRGGVAFLDFLMRRFDGDPILVLAGYNAGENSIPAHDGVPPYAETRDYVPKVLAAFQVARGLCLTPPELVSDGCVFTVASR